MSTVEIHICQDGHAWDEFVRTHPRASIYHLYCWMGIYREIFKFEPFYLASFRAGKVDGILPAVMMRTLTGQKMLISLPYVNYAGIIAGDDEIRQALWGRVTDIAREQGCRWVELRFRQDGDFLSDMQVRRHKIREYLELPDHPDILWKTFKAKLRSQIRKASKNGLEAEFGSGNFLDDFYTIYLDNMTHLGSPALPRAFFESILEALPAQATICRIRAEHKVMAASFLLGFNDVLEVPWAASLMEYRALGPNMLLYWSMIEEAIRRGYKFFDMGRSTPDSGSHRFKTQWDGRSNELPWVYWCREPGGYPGFTNGSGHRGLVRGVWSHLPAFLTRPLGTRLIRHIPS